MRFTNQDYKQLQQLMDEKPENRELIQKLLDSHQFTVSKISHEVRNPLTLIYSTLQLIEARHPEAREFKHWNHMREDIEFTISLLQELSAYNNSGKLSTEPFSALDFLSRICLSFAASCVDSEIEFTSRLAPSLPAIEGDKVKLKEALLNLLGNARDAVHSVPSTNSNHLPKQILLAASVEAGFLKIQITDNGCGIPEEQVENLFVPFVTHKSGGTGLGLAIVKNTVEAHHGTVSVSSVPHQGTCFTVLLPVS